MLIQCDTFRLEYMGLGEVVVQVKISGHPVTETTRKITGQPSFSDINYLIAQLGKIMDNPAKVITKNHIGNSILADLH